MQICKFSSEIKRAWKLRYNQKIEETIAIVSELKMNLGIPSHELDLCSLRDLMRASDAPALFADLILLNASLLRAQRNIDSSRRLITFMEVILREMNLLPHFRLIFEKGITSLIHGNYSQALEEFMGASKISPSVDARGAALINALLCMEDLGFDPTSLYQETRKTLSQLKASEHPGILDQLECFELRQCFRKGNFRALKMAGNEKDHLPYQANYYKRWVNQIPYHRYASAFGEQNERIPLSTLLPDWHFAWNFESERQRRYETYRDGRATLSLDVALARSSTKFPRTKNYVDSA